MPSLRKLGRRALFALHIRRKGVTFRDLYDFPNPPTKPCRLCKQPKSWEFCSSVKTCGATIDWDEVYGR